MTDSFTLSTPLWIWTSDKAPASWHFLTIAGEVAEAIRVGALMYRLEMGHAQKRGWGSIKITATIGDTHWETSIFPAKDAGGYMLPVKASVRKAEKLVAGDDVTLTITPHY